MLAAASQLLSGLGGLLFSIKRHFIKGFNAQNHNGLMKKHWRICTFISLSLGSLLGGTLMWMVWQHNAQCEIHCPELGVDLGYWLTLGGAGLVLGFAASMVLGGLLLWVLQKLQKA